MSFFMLQPCTCGAANCRRVLGSSVRTVGPRQCSACQTILLQVRHELRWLDCYHVLLDCKCVWCENQAGVEGSVDLHPQLATPVCRWRQKNWIRNHSILYSWYSAPAALKPWRLWRASQCAVGVPTRVWTVSPVSSATPDSAARFICLHPNLLS